MSATAVIVDDEPLALSHLQRKLQSLWPDLQVLGEANNGTEAIAIIRAAQPDIVFLDIRMPGLSGLDVAAALPGTCQIVFVSAYDQYAINAFEHSAVDYLLKPVSDKRLLQCIARLRRRQTPDLASVHDLLKQFGENRPQHLVWLRTGLDDVTELLSVDEVVFFQAQQKYTSVFTPDREHLLRMPMKQLAARLDPDAFWRIHRSVIVRVDQILNAKRDFRGRYTVTLRQRPERLRSSAAYGYQFKRM